MKKTVLFLMAIAFIANARAGESDLFPEIQGMKMKIEKRVYNSGDLWELIDGAADIFLSYYFQDLHIAEYTVKDKTIRVELYHQKTPEDAYGIYTAERMPDYPQVSVGAQGYKSQGVLNFVTGVYYVKVMSAGVTEADEGSIAQVAVKMNEKLAQSGELPEVINLFPEEGKVPWSDNYIAQNYLGYSFLRCAFTVRYDKPENYQIFIIKLTYEEIQRMVNQYFQMLKEDKFQQKNGMYIVKDLFNGTVFMKQKGNYLVGVVSTPNEGTADFAINKVMERIP